MRTDSEEPLITFLGQAGRRRSSSHQRDLLPFRDRLYRLEQDHKDWVHTSTEAHVELDRDSKARHAETKAELEALELKLFAALDKKATTTNTRIDGIVQEQKADQKELKSVRNSRVTAWIGIGLVSLSNLALWLITGGGRP